MALCLLIPDKKIFMFSRYMYKIVSEYDQEIPQSQTVDKPIVPLGRATQQSWETRKTNQAKLPALSLSLFPIKLIAKLEGKQINLQQNIQ